MKIHRWDRRVINGYWRNRRARSEGSLPSEPAIGPSKTRTTKHWIKLQEIRVSDCVLYCVYVCADWWWMLCVMVMWLIGGCYGSGKWNGSRAYECLSANADMPCFATPTPSARLRRNGATQQPIQAMLWASSNFTGVLGRYLAKVRQGTYYKNKLREQLLYTTRHWTDEPTRNGLLPTIPTPPVSIKATGYSHPSNAPRTTLPPGNRHRVKSSTPRRGSQGAKNAPPVPNPMQSFTTAYSTLVRSTG